MKAIVTGAGGFVGRALLPLLAGAASLRLSPADWRERIASADFAGATVFHLAARVHDAQLHDEQAYVEDNVGKTEALAAAAARGGADAFVFVSTIKVNGEETRGVAFIESDRPAPLDAYARSKHAAEAALQRIAATSTLRVRIVRPTLVYGPRATGNLAALVALCDSAWPLPFGALRNRRSFVGVHDLAELLVRCAQAQDAGVRLWLAAHPRPVSTRELAAALRAALGRPPRLVPVPAALLEAAAGVAGRAAQGRRLARSLEVDSALARQELGWQPRESLDEVAAGIVRAYRLQGAS